jgi:predicted AAA+ superfamily ATPase
LGYLQPITRLPGIRLSDLQDIDQQKARIDANTRQFVAGQPANNVLLTGARGSGKSSLIKALLNEYAPRGPARDRGREGRPDRSAGHRRIDRRTPERFIIFCDDLSFDAGDARYKALKVVLDGSIAARPEQCPDLRHLEPPAPDARVFRREPREQARR